MIQAVGLSFVVVLLAELGDKSQLMTLAFAARYRARTVLVAVGIAALLVTGLAVLVGSVLGSFVPSHVVAVAAGIVFLVFAAWTLRGDDRTAAGEAAPVGTSRRAILAIASAFVLAEIGDKTMLAIVTLAATEDPVGTWLGSSFGMLAADALAIAAGAFLGSRLPERAIRVIAAMAFAVFGVILVLEGLGIL